MTDAQRVSGSLAVFRLGGPAADRRETLLELRADGAVMAFNGHVDLGTGIGTALAQIVAEELDVALERVAMVLGDTNRTPDQGPTIASETIQVAAVPLRAAAAQARRHLTALAARRLNAAAETLRIDDGIVSDPSAEGRSVSYGALIEGEVIELPLALDTPVKARSDYRIVGHPAERIDIPAKATGRFVYVHDVRRPGMLHGRVVRPPYAGLDSGDFVGTSLISVDETSIAHVSGIVAVVTIGDFIGIVAEREEQAAEAADTLRAAWKPLPPLRDLVDIPNALTTQPSAPRKLLDKGNVDAAIAALPNPMARRYVWPYHLHASIGPSCAVAEWRADGLTLWSGTQNPHKLRGDLALLVGLPEAQVEIVRHQAAGCYGRNCADDVSADAALLSRAVGRPVRVQLTRAQEHAWEPKGAAQLMDVNGGLGPDGEVAAYDFATRYPSNLAPTLALLLTGTLPPNATPSDMGDRTSIAPYDFANMRVTVHDMAPIVRASWMRGVSAMPNSFAHESYIDEMAADAKADPVEFRLRYLKDARAADLVRAVAERAGWEPRSGPRLQAIDAETLKGQGFAYAVYVHGTFPGTAAAWSAWAVDVEVKPATGEVALTRVVVGQDSGLMINEAGVRHQIHGNVIQSISRVMKEQVTFDERAVTSREWGAYPILKFPELPSVDVVMMPRPDEPPLGVGESASVPAAAAIANAIFDATGVRFRELPFTPERVRSALSGRVDAGVPARNAPRRRVRRFLGHLGTGLAAVLGTACLSLAIRPAIPPIERPDPAAFAPGTIARGRTLAALGDCAVCHTASGGAPYAGGPGLETPFGTVYATNITPDPETGIGAWSYPAFARAMREGVHRDGRHLYPAFPYTAFAKAGDADLQALYAYLMAQEPVRSQTPKTTLAFPLNLRPVMSLWNLVFHRAEPLSPDPARSAAWNRGRYLVEGLGHCGGCHSPRNFLGAEKTGAAHLAGGFAEGWDAPALTVLSRAPVPWTAQALFDYLRTGYSDQHGPAAGPMAAVVRELAALPDDDIRAMADYLASFGTETGDTEAQARADMLKTRPSLKIMPGTGARLYEGSCAVCHESDGPRLFGVKPALALNSNLQSDRPDNVIRVILQGIAAQGRGERGAMPGFAASFDDRQVADLVAYLRQQFAPARPAWPDIEATVKAIRTAPR